MNNVTTWIDVVEESVSIYKTLQADGTLARIGAVAGVVGGAVLAIVKKVTNHSSTTVAK